MSEFKEVWFVWDGDKISHAKKLRKKGVKKDVINLSPSITLGSLDDDINITHYTLGQKRRRVECPECQGKGKWKENHWFTRRCGECNGTGKVWEYSE